MGTAGKFKQNENMILGADFQTSSVAETPIAVKRWAENTNYRLENSQTKDEFLQNLMAAHINFERIHPFEDGNGRTGRELINLELAKNEMPFLIIEKDNKAQYITYEADQDVVSLTEYAKQKLATEQKRYEIFERNFKVQEEFDKNQQE
ncbi:Fic family protein [Lactobacillus helveticus]|uniref:Fic family protein n=1 Tax=Lactobacillus helveticus TaxID=1587 RepID=UPI0027E2FBF1|nr:Fic family protein [Lactobacillus helveticus]